MTARAGRALGLLLLLGACSPPAEPVGTWADAELREALEAFAVRVSRGDTLHAAVPVPAAEADVVLTLDAGRAAQLEGAGWALGTPLLRAELVVVGPAGARLAPSLAAALEGRRVALPPAGTAPGRLARLSLEPLDGLLESPLDTLSTPNPAEAVAEGRAGAGLALASQALSPTRLAVVYRVSATDAPPLGVRVAVRPEAPAAARAFADALGAPGALRVWAAFGFRPPGPRAGPGE